MTPMSKTATPLQIIVNVGPTSTITSTPEASAATIVSKKEFSLCVGPSSTRSTSTPSEFTYPSQLPHPQFRCSQSNGWAVFSLPFGDDGRDYIEGPSADGGNGDNGIDDWDDNVSELSMELDVGVAAPDLPSATDIAEKWLTSTCDLPSQPPSLSALHLHPLMAPQMMSGDEHGAEAAPPLVTNGSRSWGCGFSSSTPAEAIVTPRFAPTTHSPLRNHLVGTEFLSIRAGGPRAPLPALRKPFMGRSWSNPVSTVLKHSRASLESDRPEISRSITMHSDPMAERRPQRFASSSFAFDASVNNGVRSYQGTPVSDGHKLPPARRHPHQRHVSDPNAPLSHLVLPPLSSSRLHDGQDISPFSSPELGVRCIPSPELVGDRPRRTMSTRLRARCDQDLAIMVVGGGPTLAPGRTTAETIPSLDRKALSNLLVYPDSGGCCQAHFEAEARKKGNVVKEELKYMVGKMMSRPRALIIPGRSRSFDSDSGVNDPRKVKLKRAGGCLT